MKELKLFKVYNLGNVKCFHLRVAHSEEEALTQCFGEQKVNIFKKDKNQSCRAEEVKIKGYNIILEKVEV